MNQEVYNEAKITHDMGGCREKNGQDKVLTIPNILSFFRICLVPVFVWLYCVEQNYVGTGYVLLLSGATDIADGFIARQFHMISNVGKVLDPIADKLTQLVMLFCLLTRFPLMLIPLGLMVVKELFMGITGLLVVKKTKGVFGAKWHGKVATFLLDVMMLVHVFWHDIPSAESNLMIGICTVMMFVSVILYGWQNIGVLQGREDIVLK